MEEGSIGGHLVGCGWGGAEHLAGLQAAGQAMPACLSPFGHPTSWAAGKETLGSGLPQPLEPHQLSLQARQDTGASLCRRPAP